MVIQYRIRPLAPSIVILIGGNIKCWRRIVDRKKCRLRKAIHDDKRSLFPPTNIVVCTGAEQCIMCYYDNEIKVPTVKRWMDIWNMANFRYVEPIRYDTFRISVKVFWSGFLPKLTASWKAIIEHESGCLVCIFHFSIYHFPFSTRKELFGGDIRGDGHFHFT